MAKQMNNPVLPSNAPRIVFANGSAPALKWPKRSGGPTANEPNKPYGDNITLAYFPEREIEVLIGGKQFTVRGSCSLYIPLDDANGPEILRAVKAELTKAGFSKPAGNGSKRKVDENSKASQANLSLLDE